MVKNKNVNYLIILYNNLIKRYGLPIEVPTLNKSDVVRILMGDKKVQEGKMRFILPNKIGKVSIYTDIVESDFLKYFCWGI